MAQAVLAEKYTELYERERIGHTAPSQNPRAEVASPFHNCFSFWWRFPVVQGRKKQISDGLADPKLRTMTSCQIIVHVILWVWLAFESLPDIARLI